MSKKNIANKTVRRLGLVSLTLASFMGSQSAYAAPSPGDNLIVCGQNAGWGAISESRFDNMKSKLSNLAYFGPTGSVSKSTFTFKAIGEPTTANLTTNSCDIWFSGFDSGSYPDLLAFVNSGGFVMAGCDDAERDAACEAVGYPTKNAANYQVELSPPLSENPLSCSNGTAGNNLTVNTAGGLSAYFPQANVIPLSQYVAGNPYSGKAQVITDSTTTPKVLLTGDIDMWSYQAGVSAGLNVNTDQDRFVVNSWKYVADGITGVMAANGGFSCTIIIPAPTSVTIIEDSNNDGAINATELNGDIDVSIGLPSGLQINDKVTVSDGNGNGNTQTITINASNIAGPLNVLFPAPADGGSITATAYITDGAGNNSGSVSDTAVIDTSSPTLTGNDVGPTNNTTPTLTGTTDQPDGSTVTVTNAAGNQVCSTTASGGNWSCTPASALPDGANTLTVSTTDTAGNAATDTLIATIDTVAPSVPTVNSQTTKDTTPVITGTADSADTITVTVNNVTYTEGDGNLVDNGDGTWSLQIPAGNEITDGTYDVSVVATDTAGNTSSDTSNNELIVETTEPAHTGNGGSTTPWGIFVMMILLAFKRLRISSN